LGFSWFWDWINNWAKCKIIFGPHKLQNQNFGHPIWLNVSPKTTLTCCSMKCLT
jgi:hypothetical protein